jgi:hypothetical protein
MRSVVLCIAALAACDHRSTGALGDGGLPGDSGGHSDGRAASDGRHGGDDGSHGGSNNDAGHDHDGGSGGSGTDGGGGSGTAPCTGTTCAHALGTGWGNGTGVAVDAQNNVYVTGVATGPMTFAGHAFTPVSDTAGFVASYRSDGTFRWAQMFNGTNVVPYGIAVDAAGTAYVIGNGSFVDFGNGHMAGGGGGFVASFATDGTFQWATAEPSVWSQAVATAGGSVYTTGYFLGSATWGPNALNDTDSYYHDYIAGYDAATGSATWANDLGAGDDSAVYAQDDWVAVAPSSGGYATVLDTFTSSGSARSSQNAAEDGLLSWQLGGADWLSYDASGNAYMTGREFGGNLYAGCSAPAEGETNGFVAALPPNDIGWSWAFIESPANQFTNLQAVTGAWDPSGNLIIAGNYEYSMCVGKDSLATNMPDGSTMYMASFASDGTPLGAVNPFPGQFSLFANSIAIDSTGVRWLTGWYSGAPNMGDGEMPQPVGTETGFYLLRYAP